ncbi:chorismate-binding protein, partial [Salipiger aestuarii]|uniref:chorismate-binding protein n=2 Tax=Salipiger aestuarii TaxID=568098 RepID=UPI0019803DFA
GLRRMLTILRALEPVPHDLYCGTIGFVSPSGRMRVNLAIRPLTLYENAEAILSVGGGIVFDFEVRSEYKESLRKARFAAGNALKPRWCAET